MITIDNRTLTTDMLELLGAVLGSLVVDRKGRVPGEAGYSVPRYKVYNVHPNRIPISKQYGKLFYYRETDGEIDIKGNCLHSNTFRIRIGIEHYCGDDIALHNRQYDLLASAFGHYWREQEYTFKYRGVNQTSLANAFNTITRSEPLTQYGKNGSVRRKEFEVAFELLFKNSKPIRT